MERVSSLAKESVVTRPEHPEMLEACGRSGMDTIPGKTTERIGHDGEELAGGRLVGYVDLLVLRNSSKDHTRAWQSPSSTIEGEAQDVYACDQAKSSRGGPWSLSIYWSTMGDLSRYLRSLS